MSEVKLVVADLDGTVVLQETHTASEEVIASVREAEQLGVKFAAVTGRPFWMAQELLKFIGFQDPCIFEGGALIMNPVTEEVLWSRTIPAETTRSAVELMAPHASKIEYGKGVVGGSEVELSTIGEPALSIWASVPAEIADDLAEEIAKLPEVAVHVNAGPGGDFSRCGVQVTHIEADKEHAVRELTSMLKIDKEHTMAVGDGNNDLPLFKSAHIKVAMGNASEELKAAADHVVPDVRHDGFASAIRSFVIKER